MRIEVNLPIPVKISIYTVFLLVFLSGCFASLSTGGKLGKRSSNKLSQYELVAIDLVNAMVQITELHPDVMPDIKIDGAKVEGSFGGALTNVLESAGYNVKQPDLGLVYAVMDWSVNPVTAASGAANAASSQSYSISVRGAIISRDYQLSRRRVNPTSNLRLQGVEATPIKLHDELFDQVVTPSKDIASMQDGDNTNEVTGVVTRNILDSGGSNYQTQMEQYQSVGTRIIGFADDSAKLSKQSIVQLTRFVLSANRDTDAVSVIGCSIGKTRHKGGNEGLARARTDSITQWLKKSGMRAERLFDESCWGEEVEQIDLPRRGVQLTLMRERKN